MTATRTAIAGPSAPTPREPIPRDPAFTIVKMQKGGADFLVDWNDEASLEKVVQLLEEQIAAIKAAIGNAQAVHRATGKYSDPVVVEQGPKRAALQGRAASAIPAALGRSPETRPRRTCRKFRVAIRAGRASSARSRAVSGAVGRGKRFLEGGLSEFAAPGAGRHVRGCRERSQRRRETGSTESCARRFLKRAEMRRASR